MASMIIKGVHISFVRSVSMDSWKEDQAMRMQMGGNQKAREFFVRYGIDTLPITQKYNTKAASIYKDKLNAELEGREITLQPPCDELKIPIMPVSNRITKGVGGIGSADVAVGSASSSTTATVNHEYFSRKHMENVQRPSDVHPSQGGKYQGFGSSNGDDLKEKERSEDWMKGTMSSLSRGWNFISTKATEVAQVAALKTEMLARDLNENVIQPTAQRFQDPQLHQNISATLSNFGKNVMDTGDKGIQFISHAIQAKPSKQVETHDASADFNAHYSTLPNDLPPDFPPPYNASSPSTNVSGAKSDRKDDEWEMF